MLRAVRGVLLATLVAGCAERSAPSEDTSRAVAPIVLRPDEPPSMRAGELPFRYPAPLYTRRIQGNVTLRLFVDRDGHVRAESTRVEESSGHELLDSAAVNGSADLDFVPAKVKGEPVATFILFPVLFRHPEAPPFPGDTGLKGDSRRTER